MLRKLSCLFVLALAGACLTRAADPDVERGKYLVTEVARCGDCHTPSLDNGQPDESQTLKGTMLNFKSTVPVPHWKAMSPDITSTGSVFKERGAAAIEKFLQTALWPDGDHADPPMPPYKLKAEDARAIVAYLKTLK